VNSPPPFAIDLPDGLLQRARNGDEAALEALYRRFERPIHALAWRLLGDIDEAMDVVHDTLLKVFAGLSGYRGEAPLWAWVRQIAANEALMRLRRRGRLSFCEEVPEPVDDGGDALPLRAAETAVLQRALSRLPDATRAVLWLFHGEGLTHEEIGQSMGRTSSFSKSQLARGTRRLRQLMDVCIEESSHA